eukprot:scpid60571/ scgid3417/ TRMT1-like protein
MFRSSRISNFAALGTKFALNRSRGYLVLLNLPRTFSTSSKMESDCKGVREYEEGGVKLLLSPDHATPNAEEAFYNPVMRINREILLCALSVVKSRAVRPVQCLDAFSATGVSGLRWLKELGNSPAATTANVTSEHLTRDDREPVDGTAGSDAHTDPAGANATTPDKDHAPANAKQPLLVSMCDISPAACQDIVENCKLNGVNVAVEEAIGLRVKLDPAAEEGLRLQSSESDAGPEPSCKRTAVATKALPTGAQSTETTGESSEDALPACMDKASLYCLDANVLLHMHAFSFIHLDPFGSCAPYLSAAFARAGTGSVVALTSTDPMTLLGRVPNIAARNFNGCQVRNVPFARELAVRMLCAAAVQAAAPLLKSVEPLFCMSRNHFATAVFRVSRGAQRTDACVSAVQKLFVCLQCGDCCFAPAGSNGGHESLSCECSHKPDVGRMWVELGPVWSGRLFEQSFLGDMQEHSQHLSIMGTGRTLLAQLLEEAEVEEAAMGKLSKAALCSPRPCAHQGAFYHRLSNFGKRGCNPPSFSAVLKSLREKGYAAGRTHFETNTIRSTAITREFQDVIDALAVPTKK